MGKNIDKLINIYNKIITKLKREDIPIKCQTFGMMLLTEPEISTYYNVLREEIIREDGITSSRISSMLTFQGFLISAVGLLMTGGLPSQSSGYFGASAINLRVNLLFLLGFVGMGMALLTNRGIQASCKALDVAKGEWEEILQLYHNANPNDQITVPDSFDKKERRLARFPRAYGTRTDPGGKYGVFFPQAFMFIWIVYIIILLSVLPQFNFLDICDFSIYISDQMRLCLSTN